jgi:hypothetical protein
VRTAWVDHGTRLLVPPVLLGRGRLQRQRTAMPAPMLQEALRVARGR